MQEEQVNTLGISLVFPQIANEHIKVCVINVIVSYVHMWLENS